LDDTKVQATASKHKAMSYGRMEEQERQLRAEVRELLAQAEAADDELPAELQRRETRLKKIGEVKLRWKSGCGSRRKRRKCNRRNPRIKSNTISLIRNRT
jgi:hypothetical protein